MQLIKYGEFEMDATEVIEKMHTGEGSVKWALWDMCGAAGVPEDDATIAEFVDQIYDLFVKKYGYTAPRIELIIPYSQAELNQIEYEKEQEAQRKQNVTVGIPSCPTCHSTRLTKLSAGTRFIDRAFFGVFSPEGRAQFRCEDCGYLW